MFIYEGVKDDVNLNLDKSVYGDIERSLGAEVGRGENGSVDSDFVAEVLRGGGERV